MECSFALEEQQLLTEHEHSLMPEPDQYQRHSKPKQYCSFTSIPN